MEISHEIQFTSYAWLYRHDHRQKGSRAGNQVADKDQSAESGDSIPTRPAAMPIFGDCSRSSASISMPWTAADSITGPASAVRCAIIEGSAREWNGR